MVVLKRKVPGHKGNYKYFGVSKIKISTVLRRKKRNHGYVGHKNVSSNDPSALIPHKGDKENHVGQTCVADTVPHGALIE